jgi:transcriptional activator SPT7
MTLGTKSTGPNDAFYWSLLEPLFKYQPRPPFTPLTSSKQIIGLLQPYFDKKFSETEENRLVEDEFSQTRSSRRPRHPPVHLGLCAPGGGRKKLGKDGYGPGSGDKKGKRKRPTEEIKAEKAERAEKRRLKMEEKKQKVAEKEQKRKLREELKEQERLAKQEAKEKKALAKKSTASSSSSSSKQLGSNSSSPSVYEKEDH